MNKVVLLFLIYIIIIITFPGIAAAASDNFSDGYKCSGQCDYISRIYEVYSPQIDRTEGIIYHKSFKYPDSILSKYMSPHTIERIVALSGKSIDSIYLAAEYHFENSPDFVQLPPLYDKCRYIP